MYVPEDFKVNKFVDVAIPSNKDYFARLGRQALPEGQYTGDAPAELITDKVSQVSAEEQRIFDEIRQAEIDAQKALVEKAAQKAAEKKSDE